MPDIQRSKPGNPRRKKKSEKTLKNPGIVKKKSTKISSEKCRKIHGFTLPTNHAQADPWDGKAREESSKSSLKHDGVQHVFFLEKKEDGVPPVEEDL